MAKLGIAPDLSIFVAMLPVARIFSLFLLSLLFLPQCRKAEIGSDPVPADRANRLLLFQQELFPLVHAIYYSQQRTGSEGGVALCGELEFVEGDSTQFPEGGPIRYRYERGGGCMEEWGVEGKGALKVTYNGRLGSEGSSVLLEGDALEHRSVRLEASYRIHQEEERMRAKFDGTEFLIDGKEVSAIGYLECERLLGNQSDSSILDDRYAFRIELKGEGIGGASYQMGSEAPIERDMECPSPWKGELWLKARDLGERVLAYGEGKACSDSVKLFVNGKERFLLIE